MKILYIELGKERECHITKQFVHSFEVDNPRTLMFTEVKCTCIVLCSELVKSGILLFPVRCFVCFDLLFYVPVNNFSVRSGPVFLG